MADVSTFTGIVPVYIDPVDNARLYTIENAARVIGVSKRTMYLWIQQGKVEIRLTAGGRKRVVAASLIQRPQESANG